MIQTTQKIFLQSLGCPKNLVDSEVMLGLLQEEGYRAAEYPDEADILIINTCGFINSAVEEGIDEILKLAEIKQQQKNVKLVVTGCMVQRYRDDLIKELPEVDLFIGTDGFQNIVSEIKGLSAKKKMELHLKNPKYIMDSKVPRTLSTPSHRSYLKITEGCANRCAYCLIPSLRGDLRSRSMNDLQEEVKTLNDAGIKEVTLVGQDLTSYGRDLGKKTPRLAELLQVILEHSSIPWIRLLYLYPTRLTDEILDVIAQNSRIVPYLDIPLQHVNGEIIKRMNRSYDRKKIEKIIEKIRLKIPNSALRTTFMVGYPGETEAHVRELEDFMKAQQFDHVGIFTYSNEPGSMAAQYTQQCPEEVKQQRLDRLMKLQAEISGIRNQRFVGHIEKVLVEGISAESDLLLEGRTRFQAPEIDGCVYITSGNCNAGDLIDVRITEGHTYDLVGEMVE